VSNVVGQIADCRSRSVGAGPQHRARGAALLVCIFAMLIVSSLVVLVLEVGTTEMAITRNTLSLSKALYGADAGIQHALAMLRADRTWRAGFIVTSTGTVGGLSKTVRATITVAP